MLEEGVMERSIFYMLLSGSGINLKLVNLRELLTDIQLYFETPLYLAILLFLPLSLVALDSFLG